MAVSGLAGYYYGSYKTLISASKPDTVVVHDTVTAVPVDTVPTQQAPAEQPDIKPEPQKPAAEVPKVEPVQTPAKFQQTVVQASAKVEKKDAKPAEDFDKYAEKDSRVRLGAYRIVGLSHEVKVQKGQTCAERSDFLQYLPRQPRSRYGVLCRSVQQSVTESQT